MKTVNFIWLAIHAAELERNKEFKEAAFQWMCAAHHAKAIANNHWAQARADFCSSRAK